MRWTWALLILITSSEDLDYFVHSAAYTCISFFILKIMHCVTFMFKLCFYCNLFKITVYYMTFCSWKLINIPFLRYTWTVLLFYLFIVLKISAGKSSGTNTELVLIWISTIFSIKQYSFLINSTLRRTYIFHK